jgi:RNA polymerase sigma factor for flagellar operon FliA
MTASVKTKVRATRPARTKAERDRLIEHHLPLVKFLACRIAHKLPQHISLEDLISAGVLGLIDAAEKYDGAREVQFKTYAEIRIRGAILDSLRRNDWAPRRLRRSERAIEEAYTVLERRFKRAATDEEVAAYLGLSLPDFHQLLGELEGLGLGGFVSLTATRDGEMQDLLNYLPCAPEADPCYRLERQEAERRLVRAIDQLPTKERQVIALYYHEELTMKEIGKVLGITESRVCQLHTKAVLRLRASLKDEDFRD